MNLLQIVGCSKPRKLQNLLKDRCLHARVTLIFLLVSFRLCLAQHHASSDHVFQETIEERSPSKLTPDAAGFLRPENIYTIHIGGATPYCRAVCSLILSNVSNDAIQQHHQILKHYSVGTSLAFTGLNAGHYALTADCTKSNHLCHAEPSAVQFLIKSGGDKEHSEIERVHLGKVTFLLNHDAALQNVTNQSPATQAFLILLVIAFESMGLLCISQVATDSHSTISGFCYGTKRFLASLRDLPGLLGYSYHKIHWHSRTLTVFYRGQGFRSCY